VECGEAARDPSQSGCTSYGGRFAKPAKGNISWELGVSGAQTCARKSPLSLSKEGKPPKKLILTSSGAALTTFIDRRTRNHQVIARLLDF